MNAALNGGAKQMKLDVEVYVILDVNEKAPFSASADVFNRKDVAQQRAKIRTQQQLYPGALYKVVKARLKASK